MPFPRPDQERALVARLRAAGCLYAEAEAELLLAAAENAGDLNRLADRRVAGEPLERILGWAEFCGLRIAVDPGVFVPRRRTELLVEQARRAITAEAVVVDLCCGTGAVGLAVAAGGGGIEVYAVDIEAAAVQCATRNLAPIGGTVYQGDLYAPLPRGLLGRVDVVVVNAPYVPTASLPLLPPEARDYEPQVALDGGADGLDIQRRVAAGAHHWLSPTGSMVVETSELQAEQSAEIASQWGLRPRIVTSAEVDATAVVAVLASAPES